MDAVVAFLVALVPSAGVLFVFWLGIRALVQADRRERAAQARIEAAERRVKAGANPGETPSTGSGGDAPAPDGSPSA